MIRYTSKQLKHLAIRSLQGTLHTYMIAYIVYYLLNNVTANLLSIITGVQGIFDLETGKITASPSTIAIYVISSYIVTLIFSVLDLGFQKMFLDGSRQQPIHWKMLFYGFKHQPDRVLIFQLILGGISLVCLLPGYLIVLLSNWIDAGLILAIVGLVVLGLGLIPLYYTSLLLSQGMLLMADHEELGAIAAIKESIRILKGNKMRYFTLALSFLGLHLICLMTFNMAYILLYPFMSMTYTHFYRNIIFEIGEEEPIIHA